MIVFNKIYSIVLFFCAIFIFGQPTSKWYDTDNGLPQSSAKDIVKDRYGFLWISTENGLVRYDGNRFLQFNPVINNNRFTDFFGSVNDNQIYSFNAFAEDIAVISYRKVGTFSKGNDLAQIMKDKDSYDFFIKNSFEKKRYHVNAFIYLGKGKFYYLHKSGKIFFKNKLVTILDNLNKDYLRDVFCFNNDIFIILRSAKKVIKITDDKITFISAPEILFNKSKRIYWSQINNQTFIIDKDTLFNLDYNGRNFDLVKIIKYDFKKNFVSSIYFDKTYNKLYIGTLSKGINILNIANFHVVNKSTTSSDNVFYSQLPFGGNKIITPKGDVYNENGLLKKYNFTVTENYFLAYDRENNLIVKNNHHFLRYKKSTNYSKHEKILFNSPVDKIYNTIPYRCISFLDTIGVKNHIVFYKDDNFKKPYFQIKFNDIVNDVKNYQGDRWIVGTRNGLYLVGKRMQAIKIPYHGKINVREIVKTDNNCFWITTQGSGFFLLRNNKLIKMPDDTGKYLLSAHSLQEDNRGFLWISTNNGLFKVLKNNLINFSNNNSTRVYYYRYIKEDGFNTNEFNGGSTPSSSKLLNGNFAFPSMIGLVIFNPDKVKSYYPTFFFLERVKFFDKKSHFEGNNLYLENDFYKVKLYIDTPYYANDNNLLIETKLQNSRYENWEKIGYDRSITLKGLDPGQYKLIVRALVSPTGKFYYKSIDITVKALFYQTLGFKIFIILNFIFTSYLMIKWNVRLHKKRNILLTKIIDAKTEKLSETIIKLKSTKAELRKEISQQRKLLETISHDIITPVKFLMITARKLYDSDVHDQYLQKKHFESFYKSSMEFYNFIKTLKEYAEIYKDNATENLKNCNLYEISEIKKNLFQEAANVQNTIIINEVSNDATLLVNRNAITVIIHNLLDNAIKNTINGFIKLSSYEDSFGLVFKIQDSGIGMSDELIEYYEKLQYDMDNKKLILQKFGLGLHLILQLLVLIDGQIHFEKNFPQGTIITITMQKK